MKISNQKIENALARNTYLVIKANPTREDYHGTGSLHCLHFPCNKNCMEALTCNLVGVMPNVFSRDRYETIDYGNKKYAIYHEIPNYRSFDSLDVAIFLMNDADEKAHAILEGVYIFKLDNNGLSGMTLDEIDELLEGSLVLKKFTSMNIESGIKLS